MSSMRVYKYGLLPPTENAEMVRELMVMAHRHQNALAEIENGRRAAIRALCVEIGSASHAALEEATLASDERVSAVYREIDARRAAARARAVDVADLEESLRIAKERLAVEREELKKSRAQIYKEPRYRAAAALISERGNELARSARRYSGMARGGPHNGAFGTYLLAESASEQSKKDTQFYKNISFRGVRDRRRFHVGLQFGGGGLPVDRIFGDDARLRVGHVDEAAWCDRSGGVARERGDGKRSKMRTTLRMRLREPLDDGTPVWGTWPIIMHRRLPADGVVKIVSVTREIVGRQERWYACFAVDESSVRRPRTAGTGRVAVAFGWREVADGALRVATATTDATSPVREFSIEKGYRDAVKHMEGLRATRDHNFNEMRPALSAWLEARQGQMPDWLLRDTKHLAQAKSTQRFVGVAFFWRDNRFDGDEEGFAIVDAWRRQENHLYEWESFKRRALLSARLEMYRVWAADLARAHGEIVIAKIGRADLAKKKDEYENETARRSRQLAATYIFERELRNAFLARGGTVVDIGTAGMTHRCHACGLAHVPFDAAAQLKARCTGCGTEWDQDVNLVRNVLHECERSRGAWTPVIARAAGIDNDPAVKREGRWTKRKKIKAARIAEEGVARKAAEGAEE